MCSIFCCFPVHRPTSWHIPTDPLKCTMHFLQSSSVMNAMTITSKQAAATNPSSNYLPLLELSGGGGGKLKSTSNDNPPASSDRCSLPIATLFPPSACNRILSGELQGGKGKGELESVLFSGGQGRGLEGRSCVCVCRGGEGELGAGRVLNWSCLLYTSPSPTRPY